MDAFEEIIGKLLDEENFWVKHSVKIDLTKEEKRMINKPSAPRPEIDLVALDFKNNMLYLIEAKSYLDSPGVKISDLAENNEIQEGRYKLLTSANYRRVLSKRLKQDWLKMGLINEDTVINYGLVAGKIYQNKEAEIESLFVKKSWMFWGPSKVKSKLEALVGKGYENSAITVISKILLR